MKRKRKGHEVGSCICHPTVIQVPVEGVDVEVKSVCAKGSQVVVRVTNEDEGIDMTLTRHRKGNTIILWSQGRVDEETDDKGNVRMHYIHEEVTYHVGV